MYIHWSHYYLPKIFAVLSFIVNPIFIALNTKQSSIGNYRYLLIAFAIFDITYSAVEVTVPGAIDGSSTAFVVFTTEGHFFENSAINQLALSIRCGYIALSYAILAIHFIYRYLVIFHYDHYLRKLFSLRGSILLLAYFFLHGVLWVWTCEEFLYSDQEATDFVFENFKLRYSIDSHNVAMLIAFFEDGSDEIMRRGWTGIIILTSISTYAITLYCVLGYVIVLKLSEHSTLSRLTLNLQRQLFKALIVQTAIPVFISFLPCAIAWYAPVFGVDLGTWNNYMGVIALSAFPVLDPLAVILILPIYRNYFCKSRLEPQTLDTVSATVIPY